MAIRERMTYSRRRIGEIVFAVLVVLIGLTTILALAAGVSAGPVKAQVVYYTMPG